MIGPHSICRLGCVTRCKKDGAEFRMLDLLVPKRRYSCMDPASVVRLEWFADLCCFGEGLVEMKSACGRDVDLLDIKNLGFDQHEH